MARSAALNPASMPFFPGNRSVDDEGNTIIGLGHQPPFRIHEQERSSASSLSISPSDYRSVKSSPSPSHQEERINGFGPQSPPLTNETSRRSPPSRQGQVDASRPFPGIESRIPRETSMLGSLEVFPEGEEFQSTPGLDGGPRAISSSSFFALQQQSQQRSSPSTPPVAINQGNSAYNNAAGFSSSPVSSLDSGSQFTSSVDMQPPAQTFESQLKSSSLIHDILDRLLRCEFTTRDFHDRLVRCEKDIGEIHRKVNVLVERAVAANAQPEFNDPFSSSNSTFSPAINGARASVGNIAPNQVAPGDDIGSISQRLNTLTSSVGQLLALQTQQIQSSAAGISGLPLIAPANQQIDVNPALNSNPGMLGHGLPNRPDLRPSPRVPNPPMRTWSAGTLDLPIRGAGEINNGSIRDNKRRSVSGLLRRDSSGIIDPQGDPRDSGPLISKWEQLNLAPDLLRSLNKFGVGPPNKIQQRALPFLLRGADIIAQAPPTQERIAAYVIPAIQIAVTSIASQPVNRGPTVIMISTTVDQATQAQRMIRDLGGPIGVRSALGVGAAAAGADLNQELRLLQQNMPHIICGTPQKLHALFTSPGGLIGSEVRFLVLDEVDQLIARNLHDFVFNIVKLLPSPRSRPLSSTTPTPSATPTGTPLDNTAISPFQSTGRRFSTIGSTSGNADPNAANTQNNGVERQTALFSNTVPQDVLNLATTIQLREPVRVLVRRDGNITSAETAQGSRGLRQYYLYLAFTASTRADPMAATPPGGGLGIIGSGRGATSAESVQAREWKLDALADLFSDVEVPQAIVYVGGMTALDAVVYKLASRGIDAVPLHGDMNAGTKLAALNKYRTTTTGMIRQPSTKVLVVYDVQVKEISHIPLIINYDLPKAVEEYAPRVAPAIAPNNYTRAGVIINFVTATGGDVEMLRSIECFYKIKCPEVPMSLRDIV
ncbi:hypothetical protein K435DRAFT_772079 [Dendrothele bispora CBS 962.96]|uniref:RNA helicase n=1 Tax=Dendrothele bispora (strain CBS 962.96) TaxID=1314807 RepID=A0A4S8MZJ3_DENBC|nr:hypothetical protein K435DRAFT_772079 [Dendrothele bispora CBS 962.96]